MAPEPLNRRDNIGISENKRLNQNVVKQDLLTTPKMTNIIMISDKDIVLLCKMCIVLYGKNKGRLHFLKITF